MEQRGNNIMLEIIQIITMLVTALVVGLTWGMLVVIKKFSIVQKSTPIAMLIGSAVWLIGIVMLKSLTLPPVK